MKGQKQKCGRSSGLYQSLAERSVGSKSGARIGRSAVGRAGQTTKKQYVPFSSTHFQKAKRGATPTTNRIISAASRFGCYCCCTGSCVGGRRISTTTSRRDYHTRRGSPFWRRKLKARYTTFFNSSSLSEQENSGRGEASFKQLKYTVQFLLWCQGRGRRAVRGCVLPAVLNSGSGRSMIGGNDSGACRRQAVRSIGAPIRVGAHDGYGRWAEHSTYSADMPANGLSLNGMGAGGQQTGRGSPSRWW